MNKKSQLQTGRGFVYALLAMAMGLAACSESKDPADEATVAAEPPAAATSNETAAPPKPSPAAPRADVQREATAAGARSPRSAAGSWLQDYSSLDLNSAFELVATGVRYEPYRGVQRGASGTALAGSGNSLDQALLLADILKHNGFRVRFVQGRVVTDNFKTLLRGMYPPEFPDPGLGAEFAPYHPSADPALQFAADHFWVEVYQPGDWLPLDPSFPRASIGEAYARVVARHDELPAEQFQRLGIRLMQELVNGDVSELGSVEERVADIGLQPISLIVHRVPKSSTENAKKPKGTGGMIGGLGGSLAGGSAEPEPEAPEPKLVAVEHQRRIFLRGEFLPWAATLVAEQERAGFIAREWLEFEVIVPGEKPLVKKRDLYRYDAAASKEPAAVRHYAINVVPGPVHERWLDEERARIGAGIDLPAWKRDLDKAVRTEPGSTAATSIAAAVRDHGDLAGVAGGHLVGLTYAAQSDAISRQVGWVNGVELAWPIPRILITSVETENDPAGGTESRVTLDLRLDQIHSIPYPGFPARSAQLFQTARGLQNSVLEGEVLSAATGLEMPVTTAIVMTKAGEDGTPLLTIGAENSAQLQDIEGLPQYCSELMADALRGGHDLIVPQYAANLGGRDRWGWWQVDRETGEVIGVMEDGQHQASTNYTLSLSKVGLDDDMGFAIGGIIGSTGTLFVISGLMLEHGETSAAMIADVEKYVKSIMCNSCASGAGASVGASGGISAGNDCMKIEKKIEAEIKAGVKVSFCESYQAGFACASGILLQGLRGGKGPAPASVGGKIGVSGNINCEQGSLGIASDDKGYSYNGKDQIRN